uniref:Uncharacterized protein n=1 Tax=Rhizophora mucronata TaxID=61149 RepID=A0A2P2P1K9_RHIMU
MYNKFNSELTKEIYSESPKDPRAKCKGKVKLGEQNMKHKSLEHVQDTHQCIIMPIKTTEKTKLGRSLSNVVKLEEALAAVTIASLEGTSRKAELLAQDSEIENIKNLDNNAALPNMQIIKKEKTCRTL